MLPVVQRLKDVASYFIHRSSCWRGCGRINLDLVTPLWLETEVSWKSRIGGAESLTQNSLILWEYEYETFVKCLPSVARPYSVVIIKSVRYLPVEEVDVYDLFKV